MVLTRPMQSQKPFQKLLQCLTKFIIGFTMKESKVTEEYTHQKSIKSMLKFKMFKKGTKPSKKFLTSLLT